MRRPSVGNRPRQIPELSFESAIATPELAHASKIVADSARDASLKLGCNGGVTS
jgi:hypothetical protein